MKRVALSILAVATFLVAIPAQAQLSNPDSPTPTTLYFHIFDTFNAFPINTQPMDVDFFEVGGTSFPTASHTIVSQQVGDYDFNTIYGFATSGPVEYNFVENGRPRFHPERGIAADVHIDESVQPTVYLYMDVRDLFSTDAHPQNVTCQVACIGPENGPINTVTNTWSGLPQALPSFTFRFEMRSGNSLNTDDLENGILIMSGTKTAHVIDGHVVPITGLPADAGGTPILTPDDSGIVEWAIPLDVPQKTIPKTDAYHVKIDWYQNPTPDQANDDSLSEGYMRLVADKEHLPRLDFAIRNPVYIEYIHPQVAAGILLIHSCVNSPWGTYDVDVANITVNVDGPSTAGALQQVISQNAHVHGLHDKCAEVSYLWRFRDEDAKNGAYDIRLQVPNMVGSATASGQAGFTLEGKKAFGVDEAGNEVTPVDTGGGSHKSPMPVGPLLALGLIAFAAVRRRAQ